MFDCNLIITLIFNQFVRFCAFCSDLDWSYHGFVSYNGDTVSDLASRYFLGFLSTFKICQFEPYCCYMQIREPVDSLVDRSHFSCGFF